MSATDNPTPIIELLKHQIENGRRIRSRVPIAVGDFSLWIETIRHFLYRLYGTTSLHIDQLFPRVSPASLAGQDVAAYGVETSRRLEALIHYFESIGRLASERSVSGVSGNRVFLGHGRSLEWLRLKDFLTTRLKLPCDEFNQEVTAGLTTASRLEAMLASASFAFLVMTAEDEGADATMRARPNVIHEIGLFQVTCPGFSDQS